MGVDNENTMDYECLATKAGCPICGEQQGNRLYRVSSSEAASHFVPETKDTRGYQKLKTHIESLWHGEFCEVIRCCECQFCYAWPFRAGDATFYDLAFERTTYPSWKWEHQQTLNSIRRDILPFSPKPPRVLEIGAGNGAFIQGLIPEVTIPSHVVCTEFSSYGIDQIRKLGVSCFDQDVRDLFVTGVDIPFHIVCMFQVLEHQDELDKLFKTITDISDYNTHLYIAVPNQKFIEFIELHDSLLDMPPNHVSRWNVHCFERIGQRYGWSIVAHCIDLSESFVARAKKYAIYRYMRQSQLHRTWANAALSLHNHRFKRLIQGLLVAWYSISKIPSFYRLRSNIYASSQWVHFVRTTS